ncbi:PAS domain-containing serine/threonine-protein kinase-like [Clavelina lepadiformis]|uniref:PAS domain-containing serine/threonine-protein kinase-like n=1 Tax=Clavelina lepadiformis TaxID=159417 RepID=UPI0040434D12
MQSFLDKQQRVVRPGLQTTLQDSFEFNQSFPLLDRKKKKVDKFSPAVSHFAKFSGDELGSCSYSKKFRKFHDASNIDLEKSFSSVSESIKSLENSRLPLGASWTFSNLFDVTDKSHTLGNEKHLNKAVLTIDAESSAILTANKHACQLFGYTSTNLMDMKATKLFKKPMVGESQKEAFMHDVDNNHGNIVSLSGKVMEAIHAKGHEFAVSMWMKKFEQTERSCCILVLEPVVRITGTFTFNDKGHLITCDDEFARIHGYLSSLAFDGMHIDRLMPSYVLPQSGRKVTKAVRKQRVTSSMADGTQIPLSVYINSQEKNTNEVHYNATVWFFTNISGLLTFSEYGDILSVNSNFSLALLGYEASELKTKNISDLLPNIGSGNSHIDSLAVRLLSGNEGLNTPQTQATDDKDEISVTLGERLSENETANAQQSCDTFEILSTTHGCDNSMSSYVHISHQPQELTTPPSAPTNHTIDHINSLLLGECVPTATPTEKTASPTSSCTSKCAEGSGLSWVELTMNDDRVDKNKSSSVNVCAKSEMTDSLKKINLLLNGSLAHAEVLNGADQLPVDNELNTSTDSAVSCDVHGCRSQTSNEHRKSLERSPYSDYQSGDGSVGTAEDTNAPPKIQPVSKINSTVSLKNTHLDASTSRFQSSGNITSTPLELSSRSKSRTKFNFQEGQQPGNAKHKDGSLIAVQYEIRHIEECNIYCIWIGLDVDDNFASLTRCGSQTLNSSLNSTLPSLNASAVSGMLDMSLGAVIKQAAQRLDDSCATLAGFDDEDWHAVQGQFGDNYDVIKAVGNGAYGFVRIARKKKNRKEFVVKFIRKEKVLDECWVDDYETDSQIPLEIALLTKLEHPNIVQVLEFFENTRFFSMVMPKHGVSVIDLFEFIDREPRLDEALASYIFRQIVSAVYFLHMEGVVHRDIKDENVIIDESFCCKLIDFGSAAFFKPDKTFATFCGTIEYCSPEVLLGQRYEGPELEVWALGITLYTLVYGENPFHDIEETIEAILRPPSILSEELMSLMQAMLQPVPEHRCTMKDLADDFWINLPVDIREYSWDQVFPSASRRQLASCASVEESQEGSEDVENLSHQMKNWLKDQENLPLSRESKSPIDQSSRNIFPLTKRLENINLNHSI